MKVNKMEQNYQILYGKTDIANTVTNLAWNVLDKVRAYKPEAKRCFLCLTEKYHIAFSKLNFLNSKNEVVTICRHENTFYLANFKDSIT